VRLGPEPAVGALDADLVRVQRQRDPLADQHVAPIEYAGLAVSSITRVRAS